MRRWFSILGLCLTIMGTSVAMAADEATPKPATQPVAEQQHAPVKKKTTTTRAPKRTPRPPRTATTHKSRATPKAAPKTTH